MVNTNSSTGTPFTDNQPTPMANCTNSSPVPNTKLTATAALVTFLLYRPYRKGARNAPASAPQDTPIIWAINTESFQMESFRMAMTAETAMKNTMNTRITSTLRFSLIFAFFSTAGFTTSSVRVEEEVSTKEERVDIDAASTSTMISATTTGARSCSMVGTTLSNSTLPLSEM